MSRLSKEIQEHYHQGLERQRLLRDEGELERVRTQAILVRYLPPAPAVLLSRAQSRPKPVASTLHQMAESS